MRASRYHVRAFSLAPRSTVFKLLISVPTWPLWQPLAGVKLVSEDPWGIAFDSRDFRNRAESGSVWELRGRLTVSRIRVVELVEDRRMSYLGLDVLGCRDYRASVDLAPEGAGGTIISWQGIFTPSFPGTVRLCESIMNRRMQAVAEELARHAEAI